MVVAVVCGLGASYMTSRLLAERDDKPAEAPVVAKVKLLVAKKNLEMHVALRNKPEDFFKEKEFIKDDVPKDALVWADLPKLKGKFLKRGLRKDDHLTLEDVMDNNTALRALPNGMRAVGIRVTDDNSASGFACVPGSHVDIVWTQRRGGDTDTFSKTLLEDVVVLAAGTQTINEGGGAMPASVVLVALSPDDAMMVTLAMETGSLRLVVRNLEDRSSSASDRATLEQLIKGKDTKQKRPAEPQVTEEHFRGDYYFDRGAREDIPHKDPVEPKKVSPLKKMTVTVRNGKDVELRHYWVDEKDNVITNPQQYFEQLEQDGPVPGPAANGKGQGDTVPKKLTPDV
jgi:Flp pilus assembly protein CpaB